ncbi:methyltransferase domain-containing protein [Flavobacterium sp. NST-5]|uniref:Methyltransferase domain-containing protein n=1 Tax=Flavobacterium ichthyis TaxID=2698827 RepID=A0ABW9ZCD7_9FLAO|nr:class I SAM-dependent methyltransferase [Flavobacterium ichthyis]NBL65750.1 methyltransferase domain-containing protein [Flavobacterium ichthyis]
MKDFLKVIDHSVSKETFHLVLHPELDVLQTIPVPNASDLPKYYESDDYISHTDNKRSLFEKMYHFVKNIALNEKISLINAESDKGILLDLGAGTGDFLLAAKNNDWQTIGVEPNEKARNIAIQKGLEIFSETKNLEENSFDVITMWHVLEHVPDYNLQIEELKRLLKPEGVLIVAVPNFNSYDAQYYKEFWAAYDVPRHLWHFSKTAIKQIFAQHEMKVTDILPMKFDAFYVSLLSEKYKTGKMNFLKAFHIGLKSNRMASRTFEYSSLIYVIKNNKNVK